MDTRRKGNKAERDARDIYEAAGYTVDRVGSTSGGHRMTDAFDHVDVIALHPDRRVRFAQVKSNQASGVRAFVEWADATLPGEHAVAEYLVRHDGAGARSAAWRVMQPYRDGERVTYRTVVDERKDGVDAGGAVVTDYLRSNP